MRLQRGLIVIGLIGIGGLTACLRPQPPDGSAPPPKRGLTLQLFEAAARGPATRTPAPLPGPVYLPSTPVPAVAPRSAEVIRSGPAAPVGASPAPATNPAPVVSAAIEAVSLPVADVAREASEPSATSAEPVRPPAVPPPPAPVIPAVNPAPVAVAPRAAAAEPVPTSPPTETPTIEASATPEPTQTPEPMATGTASPTATPAPQTPSPTTVPATCAGDERMTFEPANPPAGTGFAIAVRSSRPHRNVRLDGPGNPQFIGAQPEGTGLVWKWQALAGSGGPMNFNFYVESQICTANLVTVPGPAPSPTATPLPVPDPNRSSVTPGSGQVAPGAQVYIVVAVRDGGGRGLPERLIGLSGGRPGDQLGAPVRTGGDGLATLVVTVGGPGKLTVNATDLGSGTLLGLATIAVVSPDPATVTPTPPASATPVPSPAATSTPRPPGA